MPRYFIDILDHGEARDEEGYDLPNLATVRREVSRTLVEMARDQNSDKPCAQLRADVRDETGKRVMVATLLMVAEEID